MTNIHTLSDAELLGVLLGPYAREGLSQRIAEHLGSVAQMPSVNELMRLHSIDKHTAEMVQAIVELSNRYLLGTEAAIIREPEAVLPLVAWLKAETQMVTVSVLLDASYRLVGVREVARGARITAESAAREVYSQAILDKASFVIVIRNHPTCEIDLGYDDVDSVRQLCYAGLMLGIEFMDYIIISKSGHQSFRTEHKELFATMQEDGPNLEIGF